MLRVMNIMRHIQEAITRFNHDINCVTVGSNALNMERYK